MDEEVLVVDQPVLGHHLGGQGNIVPDKGVDGAPHRPLGHACHQDQLLFDRPQLFVEVPPGNRHPNRPVM